jgi:hypothetical protein
MQTPVDIPARELETLNDLSKAEGVSRDELVRPAIETFIDAKRATPLTDGFGLWKDKGIGTDEYLRKLRSE